MTAKEEDSKSKKVLNKAKPKGYIWAEQVKNKTHKRKLFKIKIKKHQQKKNTSDKTK